MKEYKELIDNKKGLWILYAQMIRSDQIPAKDLYELKNNNPKFFDWYEDKFVIYHTNLQNLK